MMKKTFAKSAMAAALALASTAAMAEFSANVSLTNDYRWRGETQSAENTAIQGGFDYFHDSGLFAGVWGSNVDFGAGDDAKVELDLYVGYWGEINEDLSYDVSVSRYTYPGTKGYDYNDYSIGVDFMGARVAYWHSSDLEDNTGKSARKYLEANYSLAISEAISLDLHVGQNFGQYVKDLYGKEYIDYSVGVSGSVAEMDLSLTYMDTNIDDGFEVKSDAFANQSAVVFTISKAM